MKNNFLKFIYQKNTTTENGALSNATTQSSLVDYFSKCGTFRNRSLEEIFTDMTRIWKESPLLALKIIFYNRMISRELKGLNENTEVQMGQGNRDEFRKSIVWLSRYHKEVLNDHLWMIPLAGSWKDLWHMDLIHELDREAVFSLIKKGMDAEFDKDLIAKFLPRLRSQSNVFNGRHHALNQFGYGLMKYLQWTPTQYRKFKSAGQAHDFQKKLSNQLYDEIAFNKIPGKALFQLVNKRGKDEKTTFERRGLEKKYLHWIKAQPIAKFTGYIYELMSAVSTKMSLAQKYTVDKQFDGLIAMARKKGTISENVWCALDTSGSMTSPVANTTAFDICLSLGVYFSTLNEGTFKDHVIMFDNVSKMKKLSGSFTDKILQLQKAETAWGSTNFQSVIDEIVRMRIQHPEIPLADYPSTLLVVSDMQFNPAGANTMTNYEAAMRQLKAVGLPNIRIVWWWVTGRTSDFPSTIGDEGVIMIGGFDGSILSLLLNEEVKNSYHQKKEEMPEKMNPYNAMLKALDQALLNKITLVN